MKKIILSAIIAFAFALLPYYGNAQCKEFTENHVMPLLDDYIISGRYNTMKLKEGEEILIFKTVSKGIDYRFVVKADDNLPQNIRLEVKTFEGETIYDNSSKDFDSVWTFPCTKTQRLQIIVTVPPSENKEAKEGCVTVLTGIKAS